MLSIDHGGSGPLTAIAKLTQPICGHVVGMYNFDLPLEVFCEIVVSLRLAPETPCVSRHNITHYDLHVHKPFVYGVW